MFVYKRLVWLALLALLCLPATLAGQSYPFPPAPPARAQRLATRLAEEAREFVELVPIDLGNSRKARQLIDDGNNLIAACDQFRQALRNDVSPGQRYGAFRDLRGAFQDTATEVNGLYGRVPNLTPLINVMAEHINSLIAMGFDQPPPRP
jgi:hypothetical protein